MAASGMKLSEGLKTRLEVKKLDKSAEQVQKAHNLEKDLGPMSISRQQEFAAKNLDIAKKQYELDPTEQRFASLREYERQYEQGEDRLAEHEAVARHRKATAEAQISLGLEQNRVGRQLMANAPQSPRKKETIKYDNI